jgi:anion-transporting  ArsA/GET3 family ATPase
MAEFFSSRLLRWLTVPARSRVMNFATRPFYQVADRILGSQFLEDIAEFFLLFQTMYDGFVERANAVTRLLHDRRTTFVVVTTLEAAPLREAEFFVDALREDKLHIGAMVLNKVLPSYLLDTGAARAAERLCNDSPAVAAQLPIEAGDRGAVARVLQEIGESFLNFAVVAKREAEQRAELAVAPDVVATVPYFETDVYDLAGLLRVGNTIWT